MKQDTSGSFQPILWVAFGFVLGVALVCVCALVVGVFFWRFSARDIAQATTPAPPDARVRIWVEKDGCHVRRSAVEGKDAVRMLTWVVRDADGDTVLERAAEGEMTYGVLPWRTVPRSSQGVASGALLAGER